jgi:hypothetical protein
LVKAVQPPVDLRGPGGFDIRLGTWMQAQDEPCGQISARLLRQVARLVQERLGSRQHGA